MERFRWERVDLRRDDDDRIVWLRIDILDQKQPGAVIATTDTTGNAEMIVRALNGMQGAREMRKEFNTDVTEP